MSALASLASTLLATLFAALTWGQWLGRRRPYQLCWALGLTFFAVAVGMELAHALTGFQTLGVLVAVSLLFAGFLQAGARQRSAPGPGGG